jgi:hypothetical protein
MVYVRMAFVQWRIQGGMGGYIPPTGLKHRGLGRSLYVKTANFFGASRRLLFQLIKNEYNNVTGKCQNCRGLQLQYFLHAWG